MTGISSIFASTTSQPRPVAAAAPKAPAEAAKAPEEPRKADFRGTVNMLEENKKTQQAMIDLLT